MKFSRGRTAALGVADAEPVGEVPLGLTAHLGPPRPTAAIGRRSWWRRHRTVVFSVIGVACAVAGVVLNAAPSATAVYVDAAGYHVGTRLLRTVGTGRYDSGGIVLVAHQQSGTTEAASSMDITGVHVVGRCRMGQTAEHCTFTLGDGRLLTADDVLVATDVKVWWQRHYSDGAGVRIDLRKGAAIPVPVLVGR